MDHLDEKGSLRDGYAPEKPWVRVFDP